MALTNKLLTTLERKYSRKRPAAKVTDKRIAKVAKRVVNANRDYKDFYTSIASTSLAGYTTGQLLSTTHDPSNIGTTIRTNQQDSAREGTNVHIKKIEIGFHIEHGPSIPMAYARLMLVRFPNNMNSLMIPTEILQYSNSPEALVSMKQEDSGYQVLWDRRISYGGNSNQGFSSQVKKTIYFKRPPVIKYNESATTGLASDIVTGLVRWFLVVTDATGTFGMVQKVTFYES